MTNYTIFIRWALKMQSNITVFCVNHVIEKIRTDFDLSIDQIISDFRA